MLKPVPKILTFAVLSTVFIGCWPHLGTTTPQQQAISEPEPSPATAPITDAEPEKAKQTKSEISPDKVPTESEQTTNNTPTEKPAPDQQIMPEPQAEPENKSKKQETKDITFAPKLTKEDGRIDWNESASRIENKVRGMKPWPGTYTFFDNRMLKIIEAEATSEEGLPPSSAGEVISADEKAGLVVKTGRGALSISVLQLEGKRAMPAELFLRGHRITTGEILI